ncbi:DNA-3-methyladenine glycosylase I [Enterovirga rhinocerotis]|uniref:DNA-3-methyladenine glycosylase I n=1 Tax=Enterovirga rhinocerotis TaxID=1339210 RepID=A0A4R7C7F0_9HYPH|nr:DNA-3-methyladenine glycosylase I [Enterovirga rhinocerotis]TDR94318.1 DNA-3-methyladenine glycosylase I [Enterovirga rhinocerotis]
MSKPVIPDGLIRHEDGRMRCWWPGTDPLYVAYHDTDWGVPERDGRALFEKLILDGFQAGLSWITILRKRDAFRAAFAGFEPEAIVGFTPAKVEALMGDAGIVRNRAKIEGTIKSARVYLDMGGAEAFANFFWDRIDHRALQPDIESRRQVQASTKLSTDLSKELKSKGFKFCGPTIVHAFMQATGMVNDHLVGCYRHAECAAFAERPSA